MRVSFDDQIFTMQPRGGISRYFAELMRCFRSDPALEIELDRVQIWTANQHLIEAGVGRQLPAPFGQRSWLGLRSRVIRAANRFSRGSTLADVVHHTYYDSRYLKVSRHTRRVITVVDMIPELFPELFPHGNPHKDKRSFVESADLILCISEATKRDLIRVYGSVAAPVEVTPLGVDGLFSPGAAKLGSLPDRYVLFVGNRGGYKDFVVLAKAFAALPRVANPWLVAVGGGPFSELEMAALTGLGIDRRARQVVLSDDELAGAYANALCFVLPSRYEGFGLSTLEAMACGCPVILADSSSHPEVGGHAADYFPPGDHETLARLIGELGSDDELRAERGRAGLTQAARFSWEKTARLTAAAYQSIAGGDQPGFVASRQATARAAAAKSGS